MLLSLEIADTAREWLCENMHLRHLVKARTQSL